MQKKLIALAIAGLSGAAFAQSNVTIYGIADATFETVRATGGASATDYGNRTRVNSNSSYIGFKGTESLSNGLAAVFQFENTVNVDNGAAGTWNNRDSFVGLTGDFGTISLGNVSGPTRALGNKMDVNAGAAGIGDNNALIGKVGGGAAGGIFDQRLNNAVAYVSPAMSGFSGAVVYSTGITAAMRASLPSAPAAGVAGTALTAKESSAAKAGSAAGNTVLTAGLNYENGPIFVGYAYTQIKATSDGATAADGLLGLYEKLTDQRLGAKYNFGTGTIGLLYDRPQFTTAGGASTKLRVSTWYLPVTVNVGAGKVIFQYGHAGNVTGLGNSSAKHVELGYEHSLSKRTLVKALYSHVSNSSAANYDFLTSVSAGASGVGAGADPKGIAVGVRHSF